MNGYRLPRNGWIVVTDGKKALFLRNHGTASVPDLQVFREFEQDNPPTREQGSSRPGRLSDGAGPHRSAVEETDWHRFNEERFAEEMAAKLDSYAREGQFTKLILVAAPQTLGVIRSALSRDVESRIVAQVDKTLTNHPVAEIARLVLG